MVLVLIGHLQGEILGYSPYILYLCIWIFSFHMPLFFIISGMLIRVRKDTEKDLKTLARKRFQGIMVPYYLFSLIYMGIVLYYYFVEKTIPVSTIFVNLWYAVGLYGINVLWFLPALFLGELLFLWICSRFSGKKRVVLIAAITVIAYGLNLLLKSGTYDTAVGERFQELCITLLRPVFACSFIGIGYALYGWIGGSLTDKTKERALQTEMIRSENRPNRHEQVHAQAHDSQVNRRGAENAKERFRPGLLFLSLLFLVVNIICIYISMGVLGYNNVGEFRSLVHNNVIVYYTAAISGSLFLILLCKSLSALYRFPLLTFYGINSLIFMAVHNNSKVLTFALRSAMYINQYLTRARGYICYAVIVLTMLVYTTLMTLFITRFFPILGGKKKNKS
ncbi:MAG: acyltransferase family protein [Lachnospiraceae bacterium]|nr:acyltransferase family protein [Lachnospiraceae bacterium]